MSVYFHVCIYIILYIFYTHFYVFLFLFLYILYILHISHFHNCVFSYCHIFMFCFFILFILIFLWLVRVIMYYCKCDCISVCDRMLIYVSYVSVLVYCPTYCVGCLMRGRGSLRNGQDLIPDASVYRITYSEIYSSFMT